MFINQGAGGNGRPIDIVCDGCTLMKGPTRNRVLRIHDSLRSGARNSTIVWCGTGPECGEGPAVSIAGGATDPVNEGNRLLLHRLLLHSQTADSFASSILRSTDTVVQIQWPSVAGATGYRLHQDGVAVSTAGPRATGAKFGRLTHARHTLRVQALGVAGDDTITVKPVGSSGWVEMP